MYSHALTYPSLRGRRSIHGRRQAGRPQYRRRGFFLRLRTQHMPSLPALPRELARVALALANAAAWVGLVLLLAS